MENNVLLKLTKHMWSWTLIGWQVCGVRNWDDLGRHRTVKSSLDLSWNRALCFKEQSRFTNRKSKRTLITGNKMAHILHSFHFNDFFCVFSFLLLLLCVSMLSVCHDTPILCQRELFRLVLAECWPKQTEYDRRATTHEEAAVSQPTQNG